MSLSEGFSFYYVINYVLYLLTVFCTIHSYYINIYWTVIWLLMKTTLQYSLILFHHPALSDSLNSAWKNMQDEQQSTCLFILSPDTHIYSMSRVILTMQCTPTTKSLASHNSKSIGPSSSKMILNTRWRYESCFTHKYRFILIRL